MLLETIRSRLGTGGYLGWPRFEQNRFGSGTEIVYVLSVPIPNVASDIRHENLTLRSSLSYAL